jgi:uncharacterized protein
LPLHTGKAPRWLFQRMIHLSAAIAQLIILEHGAVEFLRRIADPVWFQAFGCVVGFDWHSSGVTTTLCGALKEGLSRDPDLPIAVCGGKAARARATPEEISRQSLAWHVSDAPLIETSRMCAKIDSSLLQDGYSIYQHTFMFTPSGEWAIVQQGMNDRSGTARRYQWFSRDNLDLFSDPHSGITCDSRAAVLNLVAAESEGARAAAIDFVSQDPDYMTKTWKKIALSMPDRHYISAADVDEKRLSKVFRTLHESGSGTYRDIVGTRGIGPKTMAALALISELVYETPPSFNDPARFSFAHGGKDGHPFPVDRKTYDRTIESLHVCLDRARIGDREKIDAFRRLSRYEETTSLQNL